ncbi:hypothetical protein L596_000768 [Steinernema carpocapsae]|uniref:Uncharacterized protein n=1 Tax=Steinernema carpocapsae TaxID=34508 RepID=A0A4U8UJF2_STECR|nr:hypothetical protein L596_000768 [Steinernema carpocapsae]
MSGRHSSSSARRGDRESRVHSGRLQGNTTGRSQHGRTGSLPGGPPQPRGRTSRLYGYDLPAEGDREAPERAGRLNGYRHWIPKLYIRASQNQRRSPY